MKGTETAPDIDTLGPVFLKLKLEYIWTDGNKIKRFTNLLN